VRGRSAAFEDGMPLAASPAVLASPPRGIAPPSSADASRALATALERVANLERERRIADALLQIDSLELHGVLDRVCRLTVELMPCDRATAYLYSSRAHGFVPVADCGTPPQIAERFAKQLYFGQSRAGGARRMIPFIEDIRAGRLGHATLDDAPNAEVRELLETLEQWAVCLIPLSSSARGSLFVSMGRPPGFDETALRIAQGVARQASNLVDQARAFQRMQQAARVRAGLAALAAALNLETEAGRIARLIAAEVAALFRIDVAAVLVPQRDGLAVLGAHGVEVEGLQLPLRDDTAVLGSALESGEVAFQNELTEGPLAGGPLRRELGLASVLVVPLMGRAGPVGCLLLGDRRRRYGFSREIADEALVLGPLASAALERAALFAKVERSEEHFRSLIENASDLIMIVGADWTLRYLSPSIERILGHSAAELLGLPVWEMAHPDDRFGWWDGSWPAPRGRR
jgi:GAF domain-containing protein